MELPKPKDPRGFTRKEIIGLCRKSGIKIRDYDDNFGVNTCAFDEKTNTVFHYPVDVEITFAKCLGYRKVSPLEWD